MYKFTCTCMFSNKTFSLCECLSFLCHSAEVNLRFYNLVCTPTHYTLWCAYTCISPPICYMYMYIFNFPLLQGEFSVRGTLNSPLVDNNVRL